MPTPGSTARFRADLLALTGDASARIGLAVSGGPDSLALTLLAYAAFPGQIAVATVDHGLRAEAAGEARFVASLCGARGIPHSTLTVEVTTAGHGLQAAARTARYAALENWRTHNGCTVIATAHHADDQAETLLMRAVRGAGVGGLAGIRARNTTIIRPLLSWRRAELVAIVAEAGITAIEDPSNRDFRYDRSRMRALLATAPELDVSGLATAAARLADAARALEWATDRLWAERVTITADMIRIDPAGLPHEFVHRLVRRALTTLNYQGRPDRIAPLIARLGSGQPASIGAIIARPGALWTFSTAPPRRFG